MVYFGPLNTTQYSQEVEIYFRDFLDRCPVGLGRSFLKDLGYFPEHRAVLPRDYNLKRVTYDVIYDITLEPTMKNIRVG